MTQNKARLVTILVVCYAAVMPVLSYFSPVAVSGMLGATLVTGATAGWGLHAGTAAAVWSIATLLWLYTQTPNPQPEALLLAIFANLLIALGMGKAIDAVRSHRDTLSASLDQLRRVEEDLRSSEERYKDLVENQGDGIVIVDLEERFLFVNPAGHTIFGVQPGTLPGRLVTEFLAEPSLSVLSSQTEARRSGEKSVYEIEILRPDREKRNILVTATPQRNREGAVIGTFGIVHDVTEQRRTESALEDANRRLTSWVGELERQTREGELLSDMGDLLQSCLDAQEAYMVISRSLRLLMPNRAGLLFMLSSSKDLLEAVTGWGTPVLKQRSFEPGECWALRRGHAHFMCDAENDLHCRHTGEDPIAAHLCLPLMAHGETLGVLYFEASRSLEGESCGEHEKRLATTVAEQISLSLANMRLRETLRNQAILDSLTGLFNRRYMEETLEREVHRALRKEAPLTVIMLDVDHFKQYNDIHGHEAGDILLHFLGSYLRSGVRAEDIACRYGGEEFTLILPETDRETGCRRAEELREGAKHIVVEHRGQRIGGVSISMGVAVLPDHGAHGGALLRAADDALYRAKSEGRDRVAVAADTRGTPPGTKSSAGAGILPSTPRIDGESPGDYIPANSD